MLATTAEVSRALAGGPDQKPAGLGRLLLETSRDLDTEAKLDLLLDLLRHADAHDVNCTREPDSEGETVNRLLDLGANVDAVETLFGENVLHKLCRLTLETMSAADAVVIDAVCDFGTDTCRTVRGHGNICARCGHSRRRRCVARRRRTDRGA